MRHGQLPIAGFAPKESKFDGIYVGRHKGKDLIYAGKVDHGFDRASAKEIQARLKLLIRKSQPYAKKIRHRGVWVEPSLLAEIEYRAKSAQGGQSCLGMRGRCSRPTAQESSCGKIVLTP